jgi:ArsR family transcriptional regulator
MKLSNEILSLVANRFRVLSEPLRLEILQCLGNEAKSVNQIVEATGASQPNVSKHLRVMQEAGILARRQEKNNVYYSVSDNSIFAMCDAVCGSLKEQVANQSKVMAMV